MMLVIDMNLPWLTAVPAFAPTTISVKALPNSSVPTIVNPIDASSALDRIETFSAY